MDYEKAGRQKDVYLSADVDFVVCPLCNDSRYKEFYKERGVLGVVRCLKCGLVYINPRLKNAEQVYWGDRDKYFKEAKLIFEGRAKHHRDPNYILDLELIYKHKPSGNFLDIGTNMGFFLKNAAGGKWNLYGVEPSPSLSEIAREYFGLNVKTAFLEDAHFENNFFDIVTIIDVFEHILEPGRMLQEIYRILKRDGILFIKVPNGLFNLFKFRFLKLMGRLKDYDIFDSYEHLIHYSQRTLQAMLAKYSFKIIKFSIGRPIQSPVWQNYVGFYYQYPCPWRLDPYRQSIRHILYILSLIEFRLKLNRIGYLAPNIIAVAKKV